MRPILLNSCARAASAAEAGFRIDAPIPPSRGVRVISLDGGSGAVVRRVARLPWASARFFAAAGPGMLARVDRAGPPVPLEPQLDGIDVAMMVATTSADADAAAAIGAACRARAVMTAGLVVLGDGAPREAVSSLRPYARVLLVTSDEEDVAAVLMALRA